MGLHFFNPLPAVSCKKITDKKTAFRSVFGLRNRLTCENGSHEWAGQKKELRIK